MDDDAHAEWVRALRLQTDTRDDAQTWRQKRTSFAVSLGNQLTETVSGKVEISSSQPVSVFAMAHEALGSWRDGGWIVAATSGST